MTTKGVKENLLNWELVAHWLFRGVITLIAFYVIEIKNDLSAVKADTGLLKTQSELNKQKINDHVDAKGIHTDGLQILSGRVTELEKRIR